MAEGQPAGADGRAKDTISFDDAALAEQCRQGDMQAFGRLVAKYQDRIFNMIYRMCGRRADAEELAQETFLKALERIGQFRGESRFYTWLFRIAANLTISHRRRSGRVRFQPLDGPKEFEQGQADSLTAAMARRRSPAPDAAAMSAEGRRKVAEALEELDDEFRLVVVLCDMEEMDYAQIARVLDVPIGTVKSRLHRARCLLREKLAELIQPQR
ncbi:MAG: sigma-70 family RNA polymerase sigma factor [Planctomycetes bacterium]|nr:sigma-70 family RNA polymerase sigma factor [Planctomycetota bacterium]